MPLTHYKVWDWGPRVGAGATGACFVQVNGVAKSSSDGAPFIVANEVICGELGRAVRLPIPPGFVVNRDGQPYHVSLDFNLTGEDLPPADAAALAAAKPALCWGMILFDIWIVNSDRHSRNLDYDDEADAVQIFDHSHAFYGPAGGRERLERLEDQIALGGHCLAREVATLGGLGSWQERIQRLPEYYVAETVEAAVGVGLPGDDVEFCTRFLLERRERLSDLVEGNRGSFPKLEAELWDQGGEGAEEEEHQEPGPGQRRGEEDQ